MITSKKNPIVKKIISLKNSRRREKEGKFIIEGINLLKEVISSSLTIDALIYDQRGENSKVQEIINSLKREGINIYEVSPRVFDYISELETPPGILGIIEFPSVKLENLNFGKNTQNEFLIILDEIQDPGNLGAIIRSADAAGVDAVILTAGCVDMFNSKSIRASAGSIFHLPIIKEKEKTKIINFLKKKQIKVIIAEVGGRKELYQERLSLPLALVFGNESRGVDKIWTSVGETIKIPIYGKAASLNVATAAAIMIYEVRRQNVEGSLD